MDPPSILSVRRGLVAAKPLAGLQRLRAPLYSAHRAARLISHDGGGLHPDICRPPPVLHQLLRLPLLPLARLSHEGFVWILVAVHLRALALVRARGAVHVLAPLGERRLPAGGRDSLVVRKLLAPLHVRVPLQPRTPVRFQLLLKLCDRRFHLGIRRERCPPGQHPRHPLALQLKLREGDHLPGDADERQGRRLGREDLLVQGVHVVVLHADDTRLAKEREAVHVTGAVHDSVHAL
mmetsp:Transcript_7340/g.14971  ORF Transcript_7340/g.14971 Transcript_7340/m.14971 type:complete len:236 (-) Transcript_7340:1152-1859(-)